MQHFGTCVVTAPKAPPNAEVPTVRKTTTIDVETAQRLEKLAGERRTSVSWLIAEAIREYVDRTRGG